MRQAGAALVLLVLVTGFEGCKYTSSPAPILSTTESVTNDEVFNCDDERGQDFKQLAKANTKFFINLYKSIKGPDNTLVSPYSIFSGLSLLQLATKGDTKTQYEEVLQYGKENPGAIHQQARDILHSLERLSKVSNETFILNSANNIFIDSSFAVKPSYQSRADCYYQAGVSTLPLQTEPEESADTMNVWISNKTNNRIKDLISAGSLGGNTQAVLVNTVYFKAPWLLPFNKFSTQEDIVFTRQDGREVRVDMMALEKHMSYAKIEAGGMVIELDYDTCKDCDEESSEMAMYVFVPDKEVDWEVFEEGILKEDILNGEGVSFDQESFRLEMPKFEISHQVDLVPALTKLGLNLGGDFTGMTSSPTQVSDVLHQAFLRVDEEGSEGAAATALFMSRMLFIPRVSVTVDRTFFISIVHKQSKVVVFAGKVDKPDKVQEE
eukprot:TRINITY_DN19560_c0_g1_i1.p1 TRINITY_DN19560_c0_g1~~TRINITY_DN19560_c0_g1_i1.p1  ORF type:complete len:437 (-),score=122.76 TRINITY_DN19560_c0_g1_i1:74-1384(-)